MYFLKRPYSQLPYRLEVDNLKSILSLIFIFSINFKKNPTVSKPTVSILSLAGSYHQPVSR